MTSYFNSNTETDNLIDKKKLEKGVKNISSDTPEKKERNDSIAGKIFSSILILAIMIFLFIFTILITSNLSFLITCGRILTTIDKEGKKKTFNDIWFPSYYFYQENPNMYPLCEGIKMNEKGFIKSGRGNFNVGLPIDKYIFDFFSWTTRTEIGLLTDLLAFFNKVHKETTIINNARVQDLLQITEFIIPKDPYYRNLLLLIIGIPIIFIILILSGISSSFMYIYNLITTEFPYNFLYLIGLSILGIIIVNFFFPFIFMIPFEVLFFPITGIIYACLVPIALIFLIIGLSLISSLYFNIKTLLKLMFVGYFAGGYKAISKNAQENKKTYMMMVGLILILTLISLVL